MKTHTRDLQSARFLVEDNSGPPKQVGLNFASGELKWITGDGLLGRPSRANPWTTAAPESLCSFSFRGEPVPDEENSPLFQNVYRMISRPGANDLVSTASDGWPIALRLVFIVVDPGHETLERITFEICYLPSIKALEQGGAKVFGVAGFSYEVRPTIKDLKFKRRREYGVHLVPRD